jgi:hypothetical protein
MTWRDDGHGDLEGLTDAELAVERNRKGAT